MGLCSPPFRFLVPPGQGGYHPGDLPFKDRVHDGLATSLPTELQWDRTLSLITDEYFKVLTRPLRSWGRRARYAAAGREGSASVVAITLCRRQVVAEAEKGRSAMRGRLFAPTIYFTLQEFKNWLSGANSQSVVSPLALLYASRVLVTKEFRLVLNAE
jgi:hypothetical protein